jgi:hypothetical protein
MSLWRKVNLEFVGGFVERLFLKSCERCLRRGRVERERLEERLRYV